MELKASLPDLVNSIFLHWCTDSFNYADREYSTFSNINSISSFTVWEQLLTETLQ